eukprot:scaffold333_cov133-Cylindrotheca_fusiformis.AAC.2
MSENYTCDEGRTVQFALCLDMQSTFLKMRVCTTPSFDGNVSSRVLSIKIRVILCVIPSCDLHRHRENPCFIIPESICKDVPEGQKRANIMLLARNSCQIKERPTIRSQGTVSSKREDNGRTVCGSKHTRFRNLDPLLILVPYPFGSPNQV